ncbi:MAG: flagellar hook-associated protein 3 [Gammaproteobacteria bacterium]|nr:MAG: flagellar hook-associated protein 3 [Gammaproteobacteria bacterium]
MRIASSQIFKVGLDGVVRNHAAVAKTQEQIAAGTRVLVPSDDPVAMVAIQRLELNISASEQYNQNIALAENKLALEESLLQASENIVQRMKEIVIATNNATLNQTDREIFAVEIRERAKELLNTVNTRDSTGEYVFSGYSGQVQPFVARPGGGFSYAGDDGQRKVQISANSFMAVNDSGKSVFVDVPVENGSFSTSVASNNTSVPPASITIGTIVDPDTFQAVYGEDYQITFNAETDIVPNGPNFTVRRMSDNFRPVSANQAYIPGGPIEFNGIRFQINGNPQPNDDFFIKSSSTQDLLTTFERIALALEDDGNTTAGGYQRLTQILGDSLNNLNFAEVKNLTIRAQLGARLNVADSSEVLNEELVFQSKKVLSEIRDLDYAEAVSNLTFQRFVLEAAQASFVRVSNLSIFNFI